MARRTVIEQDRQLPAGLLAGDMRRTVYITGEADTFFSIPAVCKLGGCRMRGYVTGDDTGNYVFRHCYC
jgi:hypothetical protein